MTEGYIKEFATVKILLDSDTYTGRTDAFIISYTKLEKQTRRIFTYLVFQFPAFNPEHYQEIQETISSKRFLYFDKFIKGFDTIYPKSFKSIVGADAYKFIDNDLPRITKYRNKILHGQLTGDGLSAKDLTSEVEKIQSWCLRVANAMTLEIGYDGVEWNSLRKNQNGNLATQYRINISGVPNLDKFIENKMK